VPSSRSSPERQLVELVQAHLARRLGTGYALTHVLFKVRAPDGTEMELSLTPGTLFVLGAPAVSAETQTESERPRDVCRTETDLPRLTPTEQAVVDVLASAASPLKGEAIARRAGKNYSGHFRGVLAVLLANGVLIYEDGYWLASRPLGRLADGTDTDTVAAG
jgi:hypothetical protein